MHCTTAHNIDVGCRQLPPLLRRLHYADTDVERLQESRHSQRHYATLVLPMRPLRREGHALRCADTITATPLPLPVLRRGVVVCKSLMRFIIVISGRVKKGYWLRYRYILLTPLR